METKSSLVLLQKVVAAGKHYIDTCFLEDVRVICINKETKKSKFMPFKVMYDNNRQFWLKNETWEYYLAGDELAEIEEKIAKLNSRQERPVTEETENDIISQNLGNEYINFAAMPEQERVEHIKECKNRLDALITQKPRQEQLVTEALVETTRDAVMHNYASLMDVMNLAEDEAKNQTRDMVEGTRNLIKASSQLISSDIFNDDLMNALVSKSNGTTIQHMTRVYLKGLAFLSYYNKLVSSSSIINKLRIVFDEEYHNFYQTLLPHVHPDDITLERVFLGGMRMIPENTFYNWAIGFLVHDIGKAAAMEYHEGEAAYNRDIVVDHVNVGYSSIINKTNYPKDASLIAAYHHEYYGHPSGYGFFRTCLDEHKKINPQIKQDFCITYDLESMMEYEAMAFFPAKILEIIDVFDSLTDSSRKYRKVMTTEEAIATMREEFIEKHHKIDIILFDLFLKFIRETASP
ncbi:MAG: metal-dependent phosphohydrolase [Treponema sp.]|jgi:HD-GYP domain-containing protein (c-di-GMP phosphodiesterase class II)|nr:metal-dependent phosphohydrolase [Treponema sp.]